MATPHSSIAFVQSNLLRPYFRLLLVGGLAIASLSSAMLPAQANGTQAGTSIRNAAKATYEDINEPGTVINATSNEVLVTVAEVAGVTVTSLGATLSNDGDSSNSFTAGDDVYFSFAVTNVGNDATQFQLPDVATLTGSASQTSGAALEFSEDGGATWAEISNGGLVTSSQAIGESIQVRVPVTLAANAQPNDVIAVQLGNAVNDGQNVARSHDSNDVYTVDTPGSSATEIDGAPVNGIREASATEQVTINQSPRAYSLATLLKQRSAYADQGTAAITDDQLTYELSLRIEATDPTGNNVTAAPLLGTDISVMGGNPALDDSHDYVLISDAIPTGTNLISASSSSSNWRVVYSTDDPSNVNANLAAWSADAPANFADVTRVGFVYDSTVEAAIVPNQTLTGFTIVLGIDSAATAPLTVANIAQVFGQSPTGAPVYDASGDQSPSNYGDNANPETLPPGMTDVNGDGIPDPNSSLDSNAVDDGFINNPAAPETGVDRAGNNTGDSAPNSPSAGGEANVLVLAEPEVVELQNGPSSSADATGPSGTTADDFTNKSVQLPSSAVPGNVVDPAPVSFTNRITNSGQTAGTLRLEPSLELSDGNRASLTALPPGTQVTLTYQGQSAIYDWNATTFELRNGSAIVLPNFQVGNTLTYDVIIDLPAITPLSTDAGGADPFESNVPPVGGFAVPILATLDSTPSNTSDPPQASNSTVNRVYTGFLRLVKESRLIQGTGPGVAPGEELFSVAQKAPATGNIIEYRITYTNISEAEQLGMGNVLLTAGNVVIVENGAGGGNNWALDNDDNGDIDTSNVIGSANDSNGGTVSFSPNGDQSGVTAVEDVTEYIDRVTGVVAPQITGSFTFQRLVN